MTATHKLFVAAALVAAGFGVATLLGKPQTYLGPPRSSGTGPSQQLAATQFKQPPVSLYSAAAVRLVPDYVSVDLDEMADNVPVEVEPQFVSNSQVQTAEPQLTAESPSAPPALPGLSPRAKLRDEAPRPLAIDSRRRDDATAPTAFEQGPASAPVISASYDAVSPPPITPPPWPAPELDEQPRTHVVIDGDSLARLAGRYLDDPRRGGEIFEANRGVLSDPELLPIGAELMIPSRSSTAFEGNLPQSSELRVVAIHASDSDRLVPVRPVPTAPGVVPQAQLSRPLPAN